jgi:hypothetical protein
MFQYQNQNSVDPIDCLVNHMSDIVIDTKCICSICKDTTYESIKNLCGNDCNYICHEKCLKQWIIYRVSTNDPVYCPNCIKVYDDLFVKQICGRNLNYG